MSERSTVTEVTSIKDNIIWLAGASVHFFQTLINSWRFPEDSARWRFKIYCRHCSECHGQSSQECIYLELQPFQLPSFTHHLTMFSVGVPQQTCCQLTSFCFPWLSLEELRHICVESGRQEYCCSQVQISESEYWTWKNQKGFSKIFKKVSLDRKT